MKCFIQSSWEATSSFISGSKVLSKSFYSVGIVQVFLNYDAYKELWTGW